jgi:hypothetical protein
LLLTTIVAGCVDGGRGSSGFDISENAAIMRVLETQECISGERLTLCPADQMATPTAATPTPPPGPTATPTPISDPRIETGLDGDETIECTRHEFGGPCVAVLAFSARSFPPGAVFRVASRLPESSHSWSLAPPPSPGVPVGEALLFDAEVPLGNGADQPGARVQFAVIVFLSAPESIPPTFSELADSGADLAFVTPEFDLEAKSDVPTATPTLTPTESEPTTVSQPTHTPTPTPTPSRTPTATPTTPADGPEITHFGVARADNQPLQPIGSDEQGRPIYRSLLGQGMTLIVEAGRGPSRREPGTQGYNPNGLPDLQVIASRPLGDGDPVVCDVREPTLGGIPATEPLTFENSAALAAAVNDFGCRVDDGVGQQMARRISSDACTASLTPGGSGFSFVGDETRVQFCLPIARAWSFAEGDTVVAARVRDVAGGLSSVREIVVRVGEEPDPMPPCPGEEREMTIARPPSLLRSSYAPASDASTGAWAGGPLRLCVGAPQTDGSRSLSLRHDVRFGLPLIDGELLCVRLGASESHGEIDCVAGGADDVRVTQDSERLRAGTPPLRETGLGGGGEPGAASLTASVSYLVFPLGTPPSRCETTRFPAGTPTALTTAGATAVVLNPRQGGTVSLGARGVSFDCARLTETDSPGTLVLPFTALDTVVQDTANVLVLAD